MGKTIKKRNQTSGIKIISQKPNSFRKINISVSEDSSEYEYEWLEDEEH